jgi:thiol-disulfide isomerase/thioredoxin
MSLIKANPSISSKAIGLSIRTTSINTSQESSDQKENDPNSQTIINENNAEQASLPNSISYRIQQVALNKFVKGSNNAQMGVGSSSTPNFQSPSIDPWQGLASSSSNNNSNSRTKAASERYTQQCKNEGNEGSNQEGYNPDKEHEQPRKDQPISNRNNSDFPQASSNVIEIDGNAQDLFSDKNFKEGLPTLVIFSGKNPDGDYWCGPCMDQKGIVDQLPEKLQGRVNVIEVAASRGVSSLASRYGINSFPSYILFDAQKNQKSRGQGINGSVENEARKLAQENDKKLIENQKQNQERPKEKNPETQKPETQKPETQKPETQKPETQKAETQKPETQKPETQKAETKETESKKNQALTYERGSDANTKLKLIQTILNYTKFQGSDLYKELESKFLSTCIGNSCVPISQEEKVENASQLSDDEMANILSEYNKYKKD